MKDTESFLRPVSVLLWWKILKASKKQVGVTAERSIITSFFMMSVIWFYNIELFNILHNWIFKNMKCYDFLDI